MIIAEQEMMIRLTAYCVDALPNEACAVLLGVQDNEVLRVTGYRPIRNVANLPRTAFVYDPEAWVSIVLDSELSRQVIGVVHSHPTADATPSETDTKAETRNGWNFKTYWIMSLRDPLHPVVRAYRITDRRYNEQQLQVGV